MFDFRPGLLGSSRRHFLEISAAAAGRIAAGMLSFPFVAPTVKAAEISGGNCFLKGTRISTPCVEVLIEELAIGDLVDTLNGPLPIKWIERQTFRKAASAWHAGVFPVCVSRFALDDQYPTRDLYLSRSHALFLDGFLIPVELLINDRSILPLKMEDRDIIEYFHIELDSHEVVFAEGAPVETLLLERPGTSANLDEYQMLYGAEKQPPMRPFARRLEYSGGRGELQGLLRLAASCVVDVRDPIHRVRDRIAAREFTDA